MKKLVCGIVGIMAAVSAASANDVAQDTAKLKAACQASDKLVWVERNQVCIPRNPCKDSKYEVYCNRLFKDVQTQGVGYQVFIEAFARTHNLDCSVVEQNSKLIGQDYVICMGNDVMVFEFDDISNFQLRDGFVGPNPMKNLSTLCAAVGGHGDSARNEQYCITTESNCTILNSVLKKVYGDAKWETHDGTNYCVIYGGNYEAGKSLTDMK